MAKKITKTIPMIAAINETAWYAQEKEALGALSVKVRWNLKKNMKELDVLASQFQEFKNGLEEELRTKYTTDEMSVETEVDDGNGNKVPGRKIKDEYMEAYQNDVNEMNAKINELLYEEEEISLYAIDMDAEVERMSDDAELSDAAMDMLSLFESEGEEED